MIENTYTGKNYNLWLTSYQQRIESLNAYAEKVTTIICVDALSDVEK